MNERNDPVRRAGRLYASLLRLYPTAYRRAFGAQMQQTFKDQYRDLSGQGRNIGIAFWLDVIGDAVKSSAKEQFVTVRARRLLPIGLLVMVVMLLAGIVIFLTPGISMKLAVIVPLVALCVVSFVVKKSSHTGSPSQGAAERIWIKQGLRCGMTFGILWVVFNLTSNLAAYDSPLYNASRMIAIILFTIGLPIAFGLTGFISGRKAAR